MADTAHSFFDMHKQGFVRVGTSTPCCRPADVAYNTAGVISEAKRAHECHVDLLVYPELTLSSYAIDDLHLQAALLDRVERGVAEVVEASAELSPVLVIGAPLRRNGKIYNCALVIAGGELLGAVPKSYLPNYREFYEKRYFAHGRECQDLWIAVAGEEVPFGTDLVFENELVRVWHMTLKPGERMPVHRHVRSYFWTAMASGRFLQRTYDGTTYESDVEAGLTHFYHVGEGEFALHNLENVGVTTMIFCAVELKKESANRPLPI